MQYQTFDFASAKVNDPQPRSKRMGTSAFGAPEVAKAAVQADGAGAKQAAMAGKGETDPTAFARLYDQQNAKSETAEPSENTDITAEAEEMSGAPGQPGKVAERAVVQKGLETRDVEATDIVDIVADEAPEAQEKTTEEDGVVEAQETSDSPKVDVPLPAADVKAAAILSGTVHNVVSTDSEGKSLESGVANESDTAISTDGKSAKSGSVSQPAAASPEGTGQVPGAVTDEGEAAFVEETASGPSQSAKAKRDSAEMAFARVAQMTNMGRETAAGTARMGDSVSTAALAGALSQSGAQNDVTQPVQMTVGAGEIVPETPDVTGPQAIQSPYFTAEDAKQQDTKPAGQQPIPQPVVKADLAAGMTSGAVDTAQPSLDAEGTKTADIAPQAVAMAQNTPVGQDAAAALMHRMGRNTAPSGETAKDQKTSAAAPEAGEPEVEKRGTGEAGKPAVIGTAVKAPDAVQAAINPDQVDGETSVKTAERGGQEIKSTPHAAEGQGSDSQQAQNTLMGGSVTGAAELSGGEAKDMMDGLSPLDDLQPGASSRTEQIAARDAAAPTSAANRVELPTRVAMQIADAARQLPDRPVEITLSPEELGKVRLSFQVSENGAMHVVVSAERADTLDLMRRNIDSLVGEFRDLGYEDSGFSFESFDQGAQGDERGEDQASAPGFGGDSLTRGADPAPDTAKAPVRLSLNSTSGMDLRL